MKLQKLFLVTVVLVLCFSVSGYSQEAKKKVLILPLNNTVSADYSQITIENTSDVLDKSLFSFIGILPFIEVPEYTELQGIEWSEDKLSDIAADESANLVIYGDFNFEGSINNPVGNVNVYVYDADNDTTSFSNQYSTSPTTIEIFDTIDEIIIDVVEQTFLIEAKLALVQFKDFNIGNENYLIYGNNQLISVATNSAFELDQKVLSGTMYNFMIERESDHVMIENLFITLDEGDRTNIGYTASGKAKISEINKAVRNREYILLLDGVEVFEDELIHDLSVTMEHSLMLLDTNNVIIDRTNFMVSDGKISEVYLTDLLGKTRGDRGSSSGSSSFEESDKALSFRAYAGQNAYGGLGIDYNLNSKMWVGLNLSGLAYKSVRLEETLLVPYASLEYGYNLFDLGPVRLSAGINAGFYYVLNTGGDTSVTALGAEEYGITAGLLLQAQWKFIYGRVLVGAEAFPNSGFQFGPSVGVKF